jgi:1-acyl-sn-glycerol-3-phosphate acyltransferase
MSPGGIVRVGFRRALRLTKLALHLLAGGALVALLYPVLSRNARLEVRGWWCALSLSLLGIRLRVRGAKRCAHALIVANHVSWLDPFILGALFPCAFVAKSEVRAWPLVGWLAAINETLFLRRESFRGARRICAEVSRMLNSHRSVAGFPEGTTTEGSRVLPFRAALFQAAVDGGHCVLPVSMRYCDVEGRPTAEPAWVKDVSLWQCLYAIAGSPEIVADVTLCEPIETNRLDRAAAATLAWTAVTDALRAPARHSGECASTYSTSRGSPKCVKSWTWLKNEAINALSSREEKTPFFCCTVFRAARLK